MGSVGISSPNVGLPIGSASHPFLVRGRNYSRVSNPNIVYLTFRRDRAKGVPRLVLYVLRLDFKGRRVRLFTLSGDLYGFRGYFLYFPYPVVPKAKAFQPSRRASLVELGFSKRAVFYSILLYGFRIYLLFFSDPTSVEGTNSWDLHVQGI